MGFIKKNIIWFIILLIGILFIYKSVDYGRSYFVNFIARNGLESQNYLDIILTMSIIKYIVIGFILSLLGLKKIEK